MNRHTFIYFFEDGSIKTHTEKELGETRPQPRKMIAYSARMIVQVSPTGRAVVLKDKMGRYVPGTVLDEVM